MILVDEMKKCWDVFTFNKVATRGSVKESLFFFYKATFIPFVVLLILVSAISLAALSSPGLYGGSVGTGASVGSILLIIVGWFVLAPIGMAENAGIIHFFGRLWGNFKNGYEESLSAVAYIIGAGSFVFLVLLILSVALSALGSFVGLVVVVLAIIAGLWLLAALISLLATLQKTTFKGAFFSVIPPILIVVFVVIVSTIVIGGLFSLGVFNGAMA